MEGYSGGYGYGDGETMCRGHWEAYNAAVKRGIEADEEAGERVHGAEYLPENAEESRGDGSATPTTLKS